VLFAIDESALNCSARNLVKTTIRKPNIGNRTINSIPDSINGKPI
jgi:hypothetical protein